MATLVAEFVRLSAQAKTRPLDVAERARWKELKERLLVAQREQQPSPQGEGRRRV
jgi:hypothetical protein